MSCKYNNCKHCGYKSECEIFKENAELKAEVNRLKLNEQLAVNNGKNLLKENAELKHEIAEIRREKDNSNAHAKAMEIVAKTRTDQLTKAKRLLKILIEDYVSEPEVFSDGSCEDNKLCNLIKEAEQFLKGVEK